MDPGVLIVSAGILLAATTLLPQKKSGGGGSSPPHPPQTPPPTTNNNNQQPSPPETTTNTNNQQPSPPETTINQQPPPQTKTTDNIIGNVYEGDCTGPYQKEFNIPDNVLTFTRGNESINMPLSDVLKKHIITVKFHSDTRLSVTDSIIGETAGEKTTVKRYSGCDKTYTKSGNNLKSVNLIPESGINDMILSEDKNTLSIKYDMSTYKLKPGASRNVNIDNPNQLYNNTVKYTRKIECTLTKKQDAHAEDISSCEKGPRYYPDVVEIYDKELNDKWKRISGSN